MEINKQVNQESQATWKEYLSSREFWLFTLTIIGGIFFLSVLFFFVFLPFFTKHGQSVTVPEVVNLKLSAAEEKIYSADLRYEVRDSQYVERLPPLTVISQEPLPLEKVKPGRKIYLVVNQMAPPTVKIPEIIDVNLQQCRYMLENWKLKIGKISYKPGIAKDAILEASVDGKSVKPGDKVLEGTKIDLVVSKGISEEKEEIPNLVGMNLNDATQLLLDKGFSVGGVKYEKNKKKESGEIFRQYPAYEKGEKINKGTVFDLWIVGEPQQDVKNED